MAEPKQAPRKKSKRGKKYAAPLTVKGQLLGKLGPEGYDELERRLKAVAR